MYENCKKYRDTIQECHDYMTDGMSSYKWMTVYELLCKALIMSPVDNICISCSKNCPQDCPMDNVAVRCSTCEFEIPFVGDGSPCKTCGDTGDYSNWQPRLEREDDR